MEHNAQTPTWIPCSATKHPLQLYVEEVTDEDLSVFSSCNPDPEQQSIAPPCYSNNFAFEGDGHCSHDYCPRLNTREGNTLMNRQKESLFQKCQSGEGLPDRQVRVRMDTERPTDGKYHIDSQVLLRSY